MDVDTERMTTDDEHMEYEEDPGSAQNDDGDEMMGDGEGLDEETMDAEANFSAAIDAGVPFPTATLRISPIQQAPILSPGHDVPSSLSLILQPLPVSDSAALDTEMSPTTDDRLLPDVQPETAGGPATGTGIITRLRPFDKRDVPVPSAADVPPTPSSHHLSGPPIPTETVMPFASAPDGARATEAANSQHPSKADEEGDEEVEDDYDEDEDEDEEDLELPLDVHSLPTIIINLPSLGARCLFALLPDDERQVKLPVWLKGRQEEFGAASLTEVWVAIRAEMVREGLAKSGEMVVVERLMDLKMGEDDVNLQSITFLELLQLHHGCGLPKPVQLHISFETNRFITRFNAISSELKMQDERRKSAAVIADDTNEAVEDGEAEDELPQDDDDARGEEGNAGEVEGECQEETYNEVEEGIEGGRDQEAERIRRREEEDLAKRKQKRDQDQGIEASAETGGSRKGEGPKEPLRVHPNADSAITQPTGPERVHSNRITSLRHSSQVIEGMVPALAPPPRSGRQEVDERKGQDEVSQMGEKTESEKAVKLSFDVEGRDTFDSDELSISSPAITIEASQAESRREKQRSPLGAKDAILRGSGAARSGEALEGKGDETLEVGNLVKYTPIFDVPKDEVALRSDTDSSTLSSSLVGKSQASQLPRNTDVLSAGMPGIGEGATEDPIYDVNVTAANDDEGYSSGFVEDLGVIGGETPFGDQKEGALGEEDCFGIESGRYTAEEEALDGSYPATPLSEGQHADTELNSGGPLSPGLEHGSMLSDLEEASERGEFVNEDGETDDKEDSMEGNTPAAPVSDVGSGRLPSPLPFEDAQMRSPATSKLTGDVIGSGRDAAADERITEPVSAQSSSIKRALDATSLGDTSLGDIVDYGEPVVKRSRS